MNRKQVWMTVGVLFLAASFASAQRYTTIDVPGAGTGVGQGTFPQNVTDSGLIFGYYVDSTSVAHGFIRSREGTYTKFDVSIAGTGAGQGTFAFSINPETTITGYYIDASNVTHGFMRTANGHITTFDAPGAGTGAGQGTLVLQHQPIRRDCRIFLGPVQCRSRILRYPGWIVPDLRGSRCGTGAGQGTGTSAGIGLNPEGAIAGAIIDDDNVLHGYFRKPDGSFVVIEVPGAGTGPGQGTDTDGIGANYFVPGIYIDSNSAYHGFIRTRGWHAHGVRCSRRRHRSGTRHPA